MECGGSKMILALFFIAGTTVQVRGQAVLVPGKEESYMEFTNSWKMEIVSWTDDCIKECFYTIRQTDQIHGTLQGDLRFILGMMMGRMYQIHRQQIEMYRRIKRRVENKFHFMKEGLEQYYKNPDGSYYIDYKPNVYINALQFITKKEIEILHVVKVVNTYITEDEIGKIRPQILPISQAPGYWKIFTTKRPDFFFGRQGPELEDPKKEEELKAKMRAEYYRKHKNQ